MATKSISELTLAPDVVTTDLFEIAQADQSSASGYKSYKQTLSNVADAIAKDIDQNTLNTVNKKIVGAINEVKQSVDGLSVVISATLEAGETDLVITNQNILETSLIDIYPEGGLIIAPTSITDDSVNHSVTFTYDAQEDDVNFKVHIINI